MVALSHLNNTGGLDKIPAIVVMLLHAGGDGKDVGVEDDVVGVEAHLLRQDAIGPRTDLHLHCARGGGKGCLAR